MGGRKGGGEWRAGQSWRRARRTGAPHGAHTMGVSAPAGDGASGRWRERGRQTMAMVTLAKAEQTASGRCKNGRRLAAPYLAPD